MIAVLYINHINMRSMQIAALRNAIRKSERSGKSSRFSLLSEGYSFSRESADSEVVYGRNMSANVQPDQQNSLELSKR